jgi:hypothetical protein
MHTVPHRDGTIQSLGSLSVNAIRLRRHVSNRFRDGYAAVSLL